jgi:predicted transcriptional regulator
VKVLDKILVLLRDYQWHSFEEMQKEANVPSDVLKNVLSFLQEQAFIDTENEKVRITQRGLRLLELPVELQVELS